jgi:hypothetical protein
MLAFLYLYGQHIYPTYFPEKHQCFNNCRQPRAKMLDQNLRSAPLKPQLNPI